jgi:hypothetical protein
MEISKSPHTKLGFKSKACRVTREHTDQSQLPTANAKITDIKALRRAFIHFVLPTNVINLKKLPPFNQNQSPFYQFIKFVV